MNPFMVLIFGLLLLYAVISGYAEATLNGLKAVGL